MQSMSRIIILIRPASTRPTFNKQLPNHDNRYTKRTNAAINNKS